MRTVNRVVEIEIIEERDGTRPLMQIDRDRLALQ